MDDVRYSQVLLDTVRICEFICSSLLFQRISNLSKSFCCTQLSFRIQVFPDKRTFSALFCVAQHPSEQMKPYTQPGFIAVFVVPSRTLCDIPPFYMNSGVIACMLYMKTVSQNNKVFMYVIFILYSCLTNWDNLGSRFQISQFIFVYFLQITISPLSSLM